MTSARRFAEACYGSISRSPRLLRAYRGFKQHPISKAAYRTLFERRRLTLPMIDPEELAPPAGSIVLPVFHPLFAGEDAPLDDLIFLISVAVGRKARRILEVGTYRARTTLALHLNCPQAVIVSYDIQVLDSPFRAQLAGKQGVELRQAHFSRSSGELERQEPFDLVFIDGSHTEEDVIADSGLCFRLLAEGGLIVWHDYRHNDCHTYGMRVPEALERLRRKWPIKAVRNTMCAICLRGQ